jgi:2-methylcitrate dehydratase PrpD
MLRDFKLDPDDIAFITLTLPPYAWKLVGHEFRIGENPTVDGQFSAAYCIANALVRGSSKLRHFAPASVCDPEMQPFVAKVSVVADEALDRRGHTAMDMVVRMRNGSEHRRSLDIAPGFPGNPLTEADHDQRFRDCIDFAGEGFDRTRAEDVLRFIREIEAADDVRRLIPLLT